MSDLVKRLREIAVIITSRNVMSHWDTMMADVDAQYCNEAAAEIERLTAELAAAKEKYYEECARIADSHVVYLQLVRKQSMLPETIFHDGQAMGAAQVAARIRKNSATSDTPANAAVDEQKERECLRAAEVDSHWRNEQGNPDY